MYIEVIKWNWDSKFVDEATKNREFSCCFYEDKEEAISKYKRSKEKLALTDAEVFLCCEVINV